MCQCTTGITLIESMYHTWMETVKEPSSVASPEFCVGFCVGGGAQVWLRKNTENTKCICLTPGSTL